MAFKMDVTAADGRTVEDAYWVPVGINIAPIDKTGLMTFYAFADKDTMDAGFAPIAGAQKSYTFSQEDFAAAQMLPLSTLFPDGISGTNIIYDVLARFAYYIARQRKDVDSGQVDENDEPIMVSFFEQAVDA